MMEVIDASFAGAWLLPDEQSGEADAHLEPVLSGQVKLAVPHLWIYEMGNLLLVASRRGRIGAHEIESGLRLLNQIPRREFEQNSLLSQVRMSKIAARFSLSCYDASYLELADRLQCPLRSLDRRLVSCAGALGLAFDSAQE